MLVAVGGIAQAGPIVWTLSGVTFTTGATASGSLTYDPDTHILSTWNIVVSGSSNPAVNFTYTPGDSTALGVNAIDAFDLSSNASPTVTFVLAFNTTLTDAGGAITSELNGSQNADGYTSLIQNATPGNGPYYETAGNFSGAGPEPGSIGLALAGCLAFWGLRKRSRAPKA
jgi:hypothetical protein